MGGDKSKTKVAPKSQKSGRGNLAKLSKVKIQGNKEVPIVLRAIFSNYDKDASGTITLETGVCEQVREELRRRGHTIRRAGPSTYGGYQCIRREEQDGQVVYHGGTEMRKDGMVHSY